MVSTHRPSADGYQKAPVVEAILDVMFEPISDDTIRLINSDLSEFYPNSEQRVRRFKLEASTETVTVSEESLIFHLSGEDPTEMAYLRKDGFSSVQLAPYRCWEDLIARFRRDVGVVRKRVSSTPTRIATRFINRIDVQFDGDLARHEEYFQAFIHLPDPFEDIGKFSFEFVREEDDGVRVNVRSSVTERVLPDAASFILDIDVWKADGLPADWDQCLDEIDKLRAIKNHYYENLLTKKALEEFE